MLRVARSGFDSRTGNKSYLVLMSIFLVLLLTLKYFSFILAIFFRGVRGLALERHWMVTLARRVAHRMGNPRQIHDRRCARGDSAFRHCA